MTTAEHYLKQELYALMRSQSAIFEFLQLGSLDGIWYWDLEEQEHEWMSPRFWELLGYDPAERQHLAAEWQDLIFPEDLAVVMENFERHRADPSHPYDQVVRYRHANGSTVWVRCRGLAIRDARGNARRLLGAHTDLTPLKRTEEELRQRSEQLQKSNRQLLEALKRIRTLEEILSICSYCKRIRGDDERWQSAEAYILEHSSSTFSHGLCPECSAKYFPDEARDAAKT